jgi:hypothetical protein
MIRTALLATLLIVCSACSPKVDEVARVRSPTGALDAVDAQPETDATVGFVEWVYVVPAGAKPRGKPVFIADKVAGPLQLQWSGNELTVSADRARVFKAEPAKIRTPRGDVTVTLKATIAEPLA